MIEDRRRALPTMEQVRQNQAARGEKRRDERRQAWNSALSGSVLANAAKSGLHQFNAGVYSTLDALLPDNIPYVSDFIELGRDTAESKLQQYREENYAKGDAAGMVGDVGAGLVSSLPSALAALVSGGASVQTQLGQAAGTVQRVAQQILGNPASYVNLAQYYGPEYDKAKAAGASDLQAAGSALLSAVMQAGIEVSGGMETAGKGLRAAVRSAMEEGMEGAAQDAVSRAAAAAVYDRPESMEEVFSTENENALVNPGRLAQNFAQEAVTGGLYSAGQGGLRQLGRLGRTAANVRQGARQIEENLQGRGTDRALWPESRPDAMQAAQEAALSPELAEIGRQQALLAQYRAQVDASFRGELPSGQKIVVGETPQILQKKGGANARQITMSQNVARKIAYPTGYLGLQHGHNLGISVLKNLPYQLENPMAILRNPQPNSAGLESIIILTEWQDQKGNPVVIPIHLDAQGALDIPENAVASTFGADYIRRLLGKNYENVLYTKENKSIDQLLSNGRPMPEAMADDTLVAYSIAQQTAQSNPQPLPAIGTKENKSIDPLLSIRLQLPEAKVEDTLVTHSITQDTGDGNSETQKISPLPTQAQDIQWPAQQGEPASPLRVGQATVIYNPYSGKTPVNVNEVSAAPALEIGQAALDHAQQEIHKAQQSGTFAKSIKNTLRTIFQQGGGPRTVRVQGVTFDGQPYDVSIGSKVAAKVASDPTMSAEKFAVFQYLDEAIQTAQYVGSGSYGKDKAKAAKVIRYDYFEKPLRIQGQDYTMAFDVEVYKGTNNFRTYKVINKIDLIPAAAIRRSTTDGLTATESGLPMRQTSSAEAVGPQPTSPDARNASSILSIAQDMPQSNPQPLPTQAQALPLPQDAAKAQTPALPDEVTGTPRARRSALDEGNIYEQYARKGVAMPEKDGAPARTPPAPDVRAMNRAWRAARDIQGRIEQAEQAMALTDRDRAFVEAALQTGSTSNLYEADNPQDVVHMVALRQAERDALEPVRQYNLARQQKAELDAAEDADTLAQYAKDKKSGFSYQTDTMERNFYDIFGKEHRKEAEYFIERYITPVHKAVAEGNRLKERVRSRVKALQLGKHESAIVQYLLEGKTGGAEQYIREHKLNITPEQQQKIDRAVREFREIYNTLFDEINETQLRNGQQPTQFRKNYAPHFTEGKPETRLARILYKLGMKVSDKDKLPTDLAGVTEQFRPGRRWFRHLERRRGDQTVYDAVKGLDNYIEAAADVITLTDSIGRLRTLEDAVRYRFSDEGTRAKIEEIRKSREMDPLARRQAMEKAYEDNPDTQETLIRDLNRQKNMGMRNLVTELRRYTDSLAGKKHRGDRGIEDLIGREIYEISRAVEGRVAANMIGANPGSWLTNFIPLTQAMGEIDTASMLHGLYQTVKSYAKDDGFADASAFLTNRRGSDALAKSGLERIADAAGRPMEWIDQFVSDTIVRARTQQNMVEKNMMFDGALDEADAFAASVMGDRSKGAMPGVFEMRNPLVRVFTMYQLEVNNQLRYLAKDLPRRMGEEGAGMVALALAKIFAGAWAYNALYSQLTGRDAALDPIGMVQDALGGLDDPEDERTPADRAKELGLAAAEQLPFVGGILGGGRVPISAALPSPMTIFDAATDPTRAPESSRDVILGELAKPAAYVLPIAGGGAIKRGIEGYQLVRDGGAYALNKEGERELMFPEYGEGPAAYAQRMLFGRYSSPQAQDYVDSGFQRLDASSTTVYDILRSKHGVDAQTAYEAIRAIQNTEPAPGAAKKPAVRKVIMGLDMPVEAKEYLDFHFVGHDKADYSSPEHFEITNRIGDRSKHEAAMQLVDNEGLDAETVIRLARASSISSSDNAGSNAEQLHRALGALYLEDLTDEQRQAAARAFILPEMRGDRWQPETMKKYVSDIPLTDVISAKLRLDEIEDEVDKDDDIRDEDKPDHKDVRIRAYLAQPDLFLNENQQKRLRIFLTSGERLDWIWSDYARDGNQDEKAYAAQLEQTGLPVEHYTIIKSDLASQKGEEGVAYSRKPKVIDALNYYDLTDEQKMLILQMATTYDDFEI